MAQSDSSATGLFSKDAWMAFVAHMAIALVVVAPIGYAGAQSVARTEAERATQQAASTINAQLTGIRERQARFEAEIEHFKVYVEDTNEAVEQVDGKLDRLLERHYGNDDRAQPDPRR